MTEQNPNLSQYGVFSEEMAGTKTIYQVSLKELMWRNFLAGASRAVGAVFVHLVGLAVVLFVLQRMVFPAVAPIVDMFKETSSSLQNIQKLQGTTANPQGVFDDFSNQLQQFQQLQQIQQFTRPQQPSPSDQQEF